VHLRFYRSVCHYAEPFAGRCQDLLIASNLLCLTNILMCSMCQLTYCRELAVHVRDKATATGLRPVSLVMKKTKFVNDAVRPDNVASRLHVTSPLLLLACLVNTAYMQPLVSEYKTV